MDTFRVARRDSLSPDSAAEDGYRKGDLALSAFQNHTKTFDIIYFLLPGRRDSGSAAGGGGASDRESRESSPRSLWRGAGRRQSSDTAQPDTR